MTITEMDTNENSTEELQAYSGIETHYIGPTNYRPSRVSARWTNGIDGRVTIARDYDHDTKENHKRAAMALIATTAKATLKQRENELDPFDRRNPGAWKILCSIGTQRGFIFGVRYAYAYEAERIDALSERNET